MTKDETKTFLKRIKQHYQEFAVDDYKLNEWYKELKDYSNEDVNQKFEEHLRSEQYGSTIPKIWFLTKYLTKENKKGQNNANNIKTNCQLCGKEVTLSEYENHYRKCSSVDYVIRQFRRFENKIFDREKIEQLDQERFDKLYDEALAITCEKADGLERTMARKVLGIE